jgi:hypothetical protein
VAPPPIGVVCSLKGVKNFASGILFYFLFYFEVASTHASLIGKIALINSICLGNWRDEKR